MNARPILFSAPMIRALLDGSKTQTRRMIKAKEVFISASGAVMDMADGHIKEVKFPYGEQGDYLWVKETFCTASFAHDSGTAVGYRADTTDGGKAMLRFMRAKQWKPSIFMPRWASRITLKMTGLRAERLQEINEIDAIAEGVTHPAWYKPAYDDAPSYKGGYRMLWDNINGEGSWDLNPFVWVLEFSVIKQNIDAVLKEAA